MSPTNQAILAAYYHATLPARWMASAYRRARGTEPVRILFYHRVADKHPNAWTMTRERFRWQIDWLQRHFDIISLADAQQRIVSGKNHRPSVAITFDDGYAENCEFALPLLVSRSLPVTYFVTTQNIMTGRPFPYDRAAGVPLAPNTPDQIRALASAGVSIGAHTRTHADLGTASDRALSDEIIGSKSDLEQMIDRPIEFFAFPFGLHANLSTNGLRLARQAGFKGVCSAYGGYNFPHDAPFHLQRFHADPEPALFKNWMTVDPRKLWSIQRFSPAFDIETQRAGGSPFGLLDNGMARREGI